MPVCGGGGIRDGIRSRRRWRRRWRGQLHSERGLGGGHSQEVRPEEVRPPQTAATAKQAAAAAAAAEPFPYVDGGGAPREVLAEAALGQLRAARHAAEAAAAPHAAAGHGRHGEASGSAPATVDDSTHVEVKVQLSP